MVIETAVAKTTVALHFVVPLKFGMPGGLVAQRQAEDGRRLN